MAEAKKQPDWERIEADYRAGVLSLREIADGSGVSHVSISKRAKRDGWTRDLSGKIKAKADELVNKAELTEPVNTLTAAQERDVIEVNAQAIANVKLSHRSDIRRYRTLLNQLLSELEAQTSDPVLFEKLADLMDAGDADSIDKMNELYRRVIALPQRTKIMKDLADTLKTLIALERESYGIAEAQKLELTGKGGGPIEQRTTVVNENEVRAAVAKLESEY